MCINKELSQIAAVCSSLCQRSHTDCNFGFLIDMILPSQSNVFFIFNVLIFIVHKVTMHWQFYLAEHCWVHNKTFQLPNSWCAFNPLTFWMFIVLIKKWIYITVSFFITSFNKSIKQRRYEFAFVYFALSCRKLSVVAIFSVWCAQFWFMLQQCPYYIDLYNTVRCNIYNHNKMVLC